MGQQQLLLLVLATVIVGLATVAGIQAFEENQDQARQDALTQRALDIATQVKSVADKPQQFGGVNYGNNPGQSEFVAAANLDTDSNSDITAPGAGSGATCSINGNASGPKLSNLNITCETANQSQGVKVTFDSEGEVSTNIDWDPSTQ